MSKAYYPNLRAVTSKVRGNKQSKRKLQGFPRPLKGVLIYQKTAAQMVLPILSEATLMVNPAPGNSLTKEIHRMSSIAVNIINLK